MSAELLVAIGGIVTVIAGGIVNFFGSYKDRSSKEILTLKIQKETTEKFKALEEAHKAEIEALEDQMQAEREAYLDKVSEMQSRYEKAILHYLDSH